jgi:ABC-type sugar transport system permease subunit
MRAEAVSQGPWPSLVAFGIQASGALVALGYVSLRAYLNRFDIPAPASLGVERYLSEATFFVIVLVYVVIWGACIVIASIVAGALLRRMDRKGRVRGRIGRMIAACRPFTGIAFVFGIAGLLVVSFQNESTFAATDAASVLVDRKPALFHICVVLCALWGIALGMGKELAVGSESRLFDKSIPAAIRVAFTIAISASLLFVLALLHGREFRSTLTPIVRVHFRAATGPAQCGFAMFRGTEGMQILQIVRGRARGMTIPVDRIDYVEWGPSLPLDVILSLAHARTPSLTCEKLLDE